jgi:hypothetical protein
MSQSDVTAATTEEMTEQITESVIVAVDVEDEE